MGNEQYAIEMLNITKRFPGIIANDNITLQLRHGEIHALLGENGAGKSTLVKILGGIYQPDGGEICISGEKQSFTGARGSCWPTSAWTSSRTPVWNASR